MTLAPGGTKKTVTGAGADDAARAATSVSISAGNTLTSTLAFSSNAVSVAEGGKASFTVTLSPAATRDVTFSWETADGTATAGSDYEGQASTDVTISAGSRSATLEVQTTADDVVEGNETFTATIGARSLPAGVILGTDTTATATITDDDTATLAFSSSAVSVVEGGKASFTVALSAAATRDVTFSWETADGTATAGSDYTAQAATNVTIPAGSRSATLEVQTTADDVMEGDESFTATISGVTLPDGVTLGGDTTATATITDDDTATLSFNPATVTVVAGDKASFTVELSKAVSSPVTFSWETADGTASAGSDYTAQTSTDVTIAAGATTATLEIQTTANRPADADRTFTVSISARDLPAGVILGTDTTATATITEDDAATLAFSSGTVSVAEGGKGSFTVTLSSSAASDVTFSWETADGTATAGSDYTAQTATNVTIPAGSTSATLEVQTTADDVVEGNETFTATISGVTLPDGVTLGTAATATATITDDDTATLSFDPATVTVAEGDEASFTVELSKAVSSAVTFSWLTADGSATAGSDYTAQTSTDVTLAAGETTATLEVQTTADKIADDDETFTVTVTTRNLPAGVTLGTDTTATATITDDDTATLAFGSRAVSVAEGGMASFTVALSRAATSDVTFSWQTADGTATAGSDYTAQTATNVTIPAGSSSATLEVQTTADDVVEGDETFTATIIAGSLPAGVTLGTDTTATATITDDDTATTDDDDTATLAFSSTAVSVAEGDKASFTVTLSSSAASDVTFSWETADGTASAGSDYTGQASTDVTISAGSTSATLEVQTTADDAVEGNETFTATISASSLPAGVTLGTDTTATATITDDDTATIEDDDTATLAFSSTAVSVAEGEIASFAVELSQAVSGAVTFSWQTADGSATAGSDYTAQTSTDLTIAAGDTSADLLVQTTTDTVAEADETFTATISAGSLPTGVTLGSATATATITDGRTPTAPTVSLVLSPSSISENGGSSTVTATLSDASSEAVTVTVSATPVSPAVAGDFAQSGTTLTIAAGATTSTGTVTITAVDDTVDAPDKEVTVWATVSGGNGVSAPADRTLTITDDEEAPTGMTLSVSPTEVSEGAGETSVTVTARLTGATFPVPMALTVSVSGDTAAADDFFPVPPFKLTIPAHSEQGTAAFVLAPRDDALDEPDETVRLTGLAPGMPTVSSMVTIRDDDESNRPPRFEQGHYVFHLPENRSGRNAPVVLGVLRASDADGDQIRCVLSAGDRDRFEMSLEGGVLSYTGDGEDFEAGPSRFELTVAATDGRQEARVRVDVRVVDLPESPIVVDDRVETDEEEPVVVDVLSNDTDPDGDGLWVVWVGGAAHGTAARVRNEVRYAPPLNWYGEDRFSYTVSDPDGLTATATVVVTVLPVNDPPGAADDEAETREDEPVVVDVLSNDTDSDGDRLRVVSVGAAAHGTTAMADGGVSYAPDRDWSGTDRFRYTIADADGLESTATVTITVLPINDAPEAVGTIPDQAVEEGGNPITLELLPYFLDVEGDALICEAASSDETAVTATVSGTTLTLTAGASGTATVSVTASDAGGLTATQIFVVRVGDRLVRAVMTDALAALGRGHLSSARMTIGRRLEAAGGGATRVRVAGQPLSLDAWDRAGAGGLEQTHDLLFRAAMVGQWRSPTDPVGVSSLPWPRRPAASGFPGGGFGGNGGSGDRLLQGTDVLLSFGGQDGPPEAAGSGGRWRVWGQGDLQSFEGASSEAAGYDGDLRTAYLGLDARLGERWRAGAAVARSGGAADWRTGPSGGQLTTALTALYPYARWGGRDTGVWAMAGIGRGRAENVRTSTGDGGESPLGLALGLLEGRRRVAALASGVEVALRGEVSGARLATGDGDETVDGLEAEVWRLRTGVEVTRPMGDPGGVSVAPFGAVSTRHDGGAGPAGTGLELAGGMRLTSGRVRIEAQGRMLALHTAADYEERGVGVTLSVGGGHREPGVSASLRPYWGAQGAGAESLWQDQWRSHAQAAGRDDAGVDARVGYGVLLPGGRMLRPFGGYGQMGGSRRVHAGANVGMPGLFGGDLDGPVQIEFKAERQERRGGAADHRFTLFGILKLGAW